ncbi:MAG: hypothetical protein IAE97_11515 [Chthoniobacterales bacterium]|nr:hypothetical protein [Chthoniobacterales bacterium]
MEAAKNCPTSKMTYCKPLAIVGTPFSREKVVLQENDAAGGDKAKHPEDQIPVFEIEAIPSEVDVATREDEARAYDLGNPKPPRKPPSQWGFNEIRDPEKDEAE